MSESHSSLYRTRGAFWFWKCDFPGETIKQLPGCVGPLDNRFDPNKGF